MPSIYHAFATEFGLGLSHRMLIARVPTAARVLDVGCSSGYLAAALVARGARWVDGIERCVQDAELARASCRQVVVGSVEEADSWARLDGPYDAIVMGDVLEHLADPERALGLARQHLAADGVIVASIPNVAHFSVRVMLACGRFDYADSGILDRTHLRFFTRSSIRELFARCGFTVASMAPALQLPQRPLAHLSRVLGRRRAQGIGAALGRRAETLFALQFISVAHATPAP